MSAPDWSLTAEAHAQVFRDNVLPESGLDITNPQDRPRAIVLAGQPGAGKSGVAGSATRELAGVFIPIDPDALRGMHRDTPRLVQQPPYTWQGILTTMQANGQKSGDLWQLRDAGTFTHENVSNH